MKKVSAEVLSCTLIIIELWRRQYFLPLFNHLSYKAHPSSVVSKIQLFSIKGFLPERFVCVSVKYYPYSSIFYKFAVRA